ncbi:tetratricopeptide repeat protein [Spirochaeta cellobiosiphila]|uniref:tetratricopeptide repeat protein n=1 Tax=Spirochaeta cellobiosiphila TaxID=504483 RepID=UPI00048CB24C|nr:tetratricopeptide repeat protein [Spirochaeta cellobiosiphila]
MNQRKLLLTLLLALLSLLLLGCPQKAEADQTKEEPSPSVEDIVQTEEPINPGDIVIEKAPVNTDTANSRDPYWSTLGYETWQGITDVTELPESLMLDMLNLNWMTWQANGYLTLEEVVIKYHLNLGELNAENLNSAGYNLYEKGDYESAMVLFTEAIELDPTYVYAHYNFACAGSLYLQYWNNQDSGLYAQQEGYYNENFLNNVQDAVFQNLSLSFFLASRYLEKSKTDTDLEYIRSLKRYSNLRQNLSEPKFWFLYGFYKVEPNSYWEYQPELNELSITLDGGFYSARGFKNLFRDIKGNTTNLWEYHLHQFIDKNQVNFIQLTTDTLPQLSYRLIWNMYEAYGEKGSQPYLMAQNNKIEIIGVMIVDDYWDYDGIDQLYSYHIEYPKLDTNGNRVYSSYIDWIPSNKQHFFMTISEYYNRKSEYYKKLIKEKFEKMENSDGSL